MFGNRRFEMASGSVRLATALAMAAAISLLALRFAAAQDSLSDAKKRGEMVVGTELQYAPFEFAAGDKPVGFDVDLMEIIAGDLGFKVKWIDLPWVSVLPGLDAKKFDMVVAATTISKARLERYNYSLPIADATVALVKRKGDQSIMKPTDIAGKVVGGSKGSAQLQLLEDYTKKLPGGAEVKVYIGSTNSFADLSAGRLSAVAGSLPNLAYLVNTRPDEFELVLPPFGPPAYAAWVLRKDPGSEPLLKAVDEEIAKLNQNGKIAELQTKWFGREMALPFKDVPAPIY
jgi:polar amino acid transport system substrate-binding protein